MGAKKFHHSISILKAKAWGLREGIKATILVSVKNIQIEGDYLFVINSLRKIWKITQEIVSLVCDAGVDLCAFDKVVVNHCFWEANKAVDYLAHKGHSCLDLQYWFDVHDLNLLSIIRKDALGWCSFRGLSSFSCLILKKSMPKVTGCSCQHSSKT